MRFHNDVYNAMLDAATAFFAGKVMRFYTGSVPTNFGTAPTGSVLAEFTIPSPSHGAAGWVSASSAFEAALAGAWQDAAANSGGNFGCFAVFNGTTVMADGSAGTGAKDIVTSLASVSTGAVFTVQKWTFRLNPALSA